MRNDWYEVCGDYGDWASFVADTKEEAIERAIRAREAWETGRRYDATGTYAILVGTLTEKVEFPVLQYELKKLKKD